jgi:hypothetical protein
LNAHLYMGTMIMCNVGRAVRSLLALSFLASLPACGPTASSKPSASEDPRGTREQLLGHWAAGNHELDFRENGTVIVQEGGELTVASDGKQGKSNVTTKHEGSFTCPVLGVLKLDFPGGAPIVLPADEYRYSVTGGTLTLKPEPDAGIMLSGQRMWKRKE